MRPPSRRARLFTGLVLAVAAQARADVFGTYGFGGRAVAMSGAQTAEADDFSGAFYNPAVLVNRKKPTFGFTFNYAFMSSEVTALESGRELDCKYCKSPDSAGFSVGALFPIGGKVNNRVAIGVGIYLPAQHVVRVMAPDPNRPFWYRYQSSPDRLILDLGIGIRATDWLNLGLGLQILADIDGMGADVKVDLFSKQVELRELDAHLASRVGPVFGLQVKPHRRLRLGAAFRWEMLLLYNIPASLNLDGVGTLGFSLSGITQYTPHTITFGAAFDVTEQCTVTLDGEYALWSRAPTPYLNLGVDLSGDVLKALGLDEALDIASPTQRTGFTDTFGGRLGLEFRINERFTARGGAFYRPTPVPKQSAPGTNILDASAVGGSLGVGFSFNDPLEIFAAPIHLDIAGMATFLLPREAKKESTDPVPSYRYNATLVGVAVGIRYELGGDAKPAPPTGAPVPAMEQVPSGATPRS
jgi:long-chain fatty acid transport protein